MRPGRQQQQQQKMLLLADAACCRWHSISVQQQKQRL
jgi:hypothetical protein